MAGSACDGGMWVGFLLSVRHCHVVGVARCQYHGRDEEPEQKVNFELLLH